MATGSNVSKTNAYAIIGPPDLSVAKANAYAVLNSLVTRVSQVALEVAVESTSSNIISQVVGSPVIEAVADILISQVTLALVIPATYYPKDEWEQPYPCTIWANRVPTGYVCLTKVPFNVACVAKEIFPVICLTKVDTAETVVCFWKKEYDLVDLTRDCADE